MSASTRNQALSAILFLYGNVLKEKIERLEIVRAKRPRRLPVVLSREEVAALLDRMEGTWGLMASLLYGSGLRQIECMRLRVKDLDFTRHEVVVREGKGKKDRVTILPRTPAGLGVRSPMDLLELGTTSSSGTGTEGYPTEKVEYKIRHPARRIPATSGDSARCLRRTPGSAGEILVKNCRVSQNSLGQLQSVTNKLAGADIYWTWRNQHE